MVKQVDIDKTRVRAPVKQRAFSPVDYAKRFFPYMELVEEAVFVVNAESREILLANSAACKFSGYKRAELRRMQLDQLHPAEELPLLIMEIERLAFELQTGIEDFTFVQKSGWKFPIDIRICRLVASDEDFQHPYFVAFYAFDSHDSLAADSAKRNEELLALMDVGRTIASALNLEEIIDLTMLKLAQVCGAKFVSLFLADDEGRLQLQRAHRNPPEEHPLVEKPWMLGITEGPYALVNEDNKVLQVENAFTDLSFQRWRPIAERVGFGSLVCLAMVPRDKSMGVFNLYYEKPRQFTPDEINFLNTAVTYLSISIENARLYREHQIKADQIAAINEITKSINSSLDLTEVIKTVSFEIKKIVDFDTVSISLFDEGSDNMSIFTLVSESLAERFGKGRWRRVGDSALGWLDKGGPVKEAGQDKHAGLETRILLDNFIKSKMNVLLLSKDKYLGTFVLGKAEPHAFTNTHQLLFRQIATQVATALENAKLYEETKRRLSELSVLADVSKTITSSLNIREVLDLIVKTAAEAMNAKICTIWFVDDVVDPSRYTNDAGQSSSELEMSLRREAERIADKQQPLIINDLGERLKRDRSLPRSVLTDDLRSFLGVPVISRDRTIAILSIYKDEVSQFEDREIKLLTTIANQAAVAIENARLYESERHRVAQLGMVNEVGKQVTSTLELSSLLVTVTRSIRDVFSYSHVSVYLLEPDSRRIEQSSLAGPNSATFDAGVVRYSQDNPIARAIESGETTMVADLADEAGIGHDKTAAGSMLCLPLRIAGRVSGCLVLHSEHTHAFDPSDQHAFDALSSQVASAIENARLFEQTRTNTDQLTRANEELENFVSTVSHDLKSPIVSVLGFSTLLMNEFDKKLGKEGVHYLKRIQTNIRQMERLVTDLLELSRVGKVVNPFEQVDFNEIVQTALGDLQYQLKHRKIKVSFASDFPEVNCDRNRILQVFTNLIDNAIKYMGDTPEPTIRIDYKKTDDDFIFSVRDNGIGIEKQYFDKIFELFQSLGRDGETEGSGVGLTIVKRVIENHGGRVWVESEPGQGAAFYFTLPREQNDLN